MNTEQLSVVQWWHSGREYSTGLMLFSRYSKNKVLIHTLTKKSARFGQPKLEYELPKSVGLSRDNMPDLNALNTDEIHVLLNEIPVINNFRAQGKRSFFFPDIQKASDSGYPPEIKKIKEQYSRLYNHRSILFRRMSGIPEVNSLENTTARASLLEEIQSLSSVQDIAYNILQDYEDNKVIPDEHQMAAVLNKKLIDPVEPLKPVDVAESSPEPDDETPEHTKEVFSADELRTKRKSLQIANYKDNNLLLYQQFKKADIENPMPESPKRRKIVKRMKLRASKIEALTRQINKL